LDKDGHPHISYNTGFDDDFSSLILAFRDAIGWHCDVVDPEGGGAPSLLLDQEGNAHISYNHNFFSCGKGGCIISDAHLMYAHQSTNGWDIHIVDSDTFTGKYSSIALDHNGSPHISYFDKGSYTLMYAYLVNGSWVIEEVDDQINLEQRPAIFLDWEDIPRIYYWGAGVFKHAVKGAAGWQTAVSFSESANIEDSAVVLDQLGYPHLSYNTHEVEGGDLKYAHIPAPDYDINTSPEGVRLYGNLGETVTTTLKIRNAGRETDGYNLTVDGNHWPIVAPSTIDPLAGGDYATISIQVSIPATATLGESDTASMTISSQTDVSIYTTITLTSYAASFTYLPLVER
jgi:hypothetical protein